MPSLTHQRRKSKPTNAPDQLPPHSLEAEKGVLGCILVAPDDCMPEAEKSLSGCNGVFYDPCNQTIWQTMLSLHENFEPVALGTLHDRLKSKKLLSEVGGMAYLNSLDALTPTAAHLNHWLGKLLEQYELRQAIKRCQDVISRTYNFDGDINEWRWAMRSDLAPIVIDKSIGGEIFTIDDLDSFNLTDMSDCLIGNGWLCEKELALLIGASGRGKSTLVMQLLIHFALNLALWGLKPCRPLTSVVFGDENQLRALARMYQGIRDVMGIKKGSKEFQTLNESIRFVNCPDKAGDPFLRLVESTLNETPRNIAVVDPLVNLADCQMKDDDKVGRFLRGLRGIAHRTSSAMLINHHTPKTSRGRRQFYENASDNQYAGIGSQVIASTSRSTITLEEISDGFFKAVFSKRGNLSGITDMNGEIVPGNTPTVYVRHGQNKVCWEQTHPPEEPEESESRPKERKKSKVETIVAANTHDVIAKIPDAGETANSLGERFHAWSIKHKMALGLTKCRTDLLYELGSDQVAKLRFDEVAKRWFKGKNA